MTTATLLEVQKRYSSRALMLAIGGGLLFLVFGYKEICRGLVLGGLFSALNFVLMALALPARMGAPRFRATLRALGSLAGRYLLLAIPLAVAVRSPRFDLVATVAGLFLVPALILGEQVLGGRKTGRPSGKGA